ncbi:MAG: hypothetical protein Ct9H300mP23_11190 [Nitrospinota bacterium]|nr:MAG: hypothetical protein Ct9H300mP23_11190 [Nitrospinota bacterium]
MYTNGPRIGWLKNIIVKSPKDNPTGPVRTNPTDRKGGGVRKVIRGGAWASNKDSQRSAARKSFVVDYRIDSLGFSAAFSSSLWEMKVSEEFSGIMGQFF